MSGYRGRQPRSAYGPRSFQQPRHRGIGPGSWMTEDGCNTARQNMPYPSFNPNRMQTPHLNQQSRMSSFNKGFSDVNSFKIPNTNMTLEPDPDIFESSQTLPKSTYMGRIHNERVSGNDGFHNMNIPYQMTERMVKDCRGPNAALSNCRSDPYLDPVSKPLHANVSQMQDRYSCITSDQNQFASSSQMSQSKNFPFISEKSLFPSSEDPFCNKVSNSMERSYKSSHLFPAYGQKESFSEIVNSKSIEQPVYTSDFNDRPNSFVDSTHVSSAYPKTSMSMEQSTYHEKALEKAIDELFQSNTPLSDFDKESFKELSDAPLALDEIVSAQSISCSSSSFPLTPTSQEPFFQSSGSMPFQKSLSMTSNTMSITSSQSCSMQNAPFPGGTEVHQSLKDCISSSNLYNFESSMTSTDIADLLPGINAFVDTLDRPDLVSKPGEQAEFSSNVSWSKPSIPFLGDSSALDKCSGVLKAETSCSNNVSCQSEPKVASKSELPFHMQENRLPGSDKVEDSVEKGSVKIKSALEEALEALVTNDAIVGLDYIIEYKKCINQKGSFPFKCTLCNSSISRPTIIDHIIGPKHRIKYLKLKNESKYEEIKSLKVERSEKDAKVTQASFELERLYGRGHVTVEVEENSKGDSNGQKTPVEEEKEEPAMVFTLDKIPIGFEALSPDHDTSSSFILDSSVSQEHSASSSERAKFVESVAKPSCEDSANPCSTVTDVCFKPSDSDQVASNSHEPSTSSSEKPVAKDEDQPFADKLLQMKRSASTDSMISNKHLKVSDAAVSEESVKGALADPAVKVKSELERSNLNSSVIEELAKCSITSDDEAEFALKAVNVLLQMFLQYQLKNISPEAVQNVMKGLQSGSSIKIDELLVLLNKNKLSDKQESVSPKAIKEEPKQADVMETSEVKLQELKPDAGKSCTTSSFLGSSTSTASTAVASSIAPPLPPPPPPVIVSSAASLSANRVSQTNVMCLNPMSFFNWPQANNPMQSPTVAGVPGNQGMIWAANPYQSAQAQYGQMPYYQPQNFASVQQGNQVFQNQFAVLSQNNIQMPHLPPPPPPLPSNPPPPPSDSCSSSNSALPASYLFSNPPPPPLS